MTTWEYRAVRVPSPHGDTIKLAEVYYGDATAEDQWPISGWCFASAPQGDSREELQEELARLVEAARRDILPAARLPGWEIYAATGVDDEPDLVAD